MIDWTKPVETTEDPPRPVRVLCTDAGEQYPIVALISREPILFTKDGHEWPDGIGITLRNVAPPKPEPVLYEGWVNLSSDGSVCTWMRKEDADATAGRKRVECRHIVWNSDGSPVDDDPRGEVVDVELLEKVEAEVNHWKAKAEALQAEVNELSSAGTIVQLKAEVAAKDAKIERIQKLWDADHEVLVNRYAGLFAEAQAMRPAVDAAVAYCTTGQDRGGEKLLAAVRAYEAKMKEEVGDVAAN